MLVESGGSVPPLDTDERQSVLLLGCLELPLVSLVSRHWTQTGDNQWCCSAVSAGPGCTIIILLTTIITGSLNFTVSTF